MMYRTIILILLGVSIGLNIALTTAWIIHFKPPLAQERGRETDTPVNSVSCALHRQLGVSEEQWEKLEPIIRSFQEDIRDQREQIQNLRGKMFKLLRQDQVDRDKIEELQNRMREEQAKMQDLVLEHILEEKKVLTDEQEKQFLDLLGNRIQHGHGCAPGGGENQRVPARENQPDPGAH